MRIRSMQLFTKIFIITPLSTKLLQKSKNYTYKLLQTSMFSQKFYVKEVLILKSFRTINICEWLKTNSRHRNFGELTQSSRKFCLRKYLNLEKLYLQYFHCEGSCDICLFLVAQHLGIG